MNPLQRLLLSLASWIKRNQQHVIEYLAVSENSCFLRVGPRDCGDVGGGEALANEFARLHFLSGAVSAWAGYCATTTVKLLETACVGVFG